MKLEDSKIIIEMIRKENYKCSDWEELFLRSILQLTTDLSAKQSLCLQNIYAKATGGGFYQKKEYY